MSVTSGTIFDRTRAPLSQWFAAIWLMTRPGGISAQELHHELGFASYETAWAWLHKLRRAMTFPEAGLLGGPGCTVVIDRYPLRNIPRRNTTSSSGAVPIMVAVEQALGHPPKVRFALDYRAEVSGLLSFVCQTVAQGSLISSSVEAAHLKFEELGYAKGSAHEQLDASTYKESPLSSVIEELQLWVTESLRHAVAVNQLPYYLDEFSFRFNHRDESSDGRLFYRLLQQATTTPPWPLDDLTRP